jgi:hypothetical protein
MPLGTPPTEKDLFARRHIGAVSGVFFGLRDTGNPALIVQGIVFGAIPHSIFYGTRASKSIMSKRTTFDVRVVQRFRQ